MARDEPSNGFAGKRTAWLDEILFIPVSDTAVRLAGVESGEYHHAMFVKQDAYERIRSLPQLEPRIVKPRGWTLIFDEPQGRAHDQQAAAPGGAGGARHGADHDRGLRPQGLLSGSARRSSSPSSPWHSTAGAALYNQRDKDKARRLMKEAGYAKQPVRWITTKEYEFMYKSSMIAKQQLEELGFVIDLQVVDWATLNQRVQKPELWETYVTGYPLNPDPALHVSFRCSFQGWWCNEEKERLVGELRQESDVKKRKALVERIQTVFYEDVGTGEARGLQHTRRRPPRATRRVSHRAAPLLLELVAR